MSGWILVFWLIGADGKVFTHASLHGFATQADCQYFGNRIPARYGSVIFKCEPEGTKPTTWFK